MIHNTVSANKRLFLPLRLASSGLDSARPSAPAACRLILFFPWRDCSTRAELPCPFQSVTPHGQTSDWFQGQSACRALQLVQGIAVHASPARSFASGRRSVQQDAKKKWRDGRRAGRAIRPGVAPSAKPSRLACRPLAAPARGRRRFAALASGAPARRPAPGGRQQQRGRTTAGPAL